MATVTSLNFQLKSGWDGSGVDQAQAQMKALKSQIDDLSSKRLQITADATETQAAIADVKKQINDLNQEIKLGVNDDDAKTKLLELQAELDALNNRSLAIKVDKTQLDAEMAVLKLELDAATKDRSVKVNVDSSTLRSSLDSAVSDFDKATNDMSNDWDGVGKAGRAASLNIMTGLLLLMPVLIPLAEGVLYLGGAIVSAFAGAGVAAGVFGFSIEQTLKSAAAMNTNAATLNTTLQQAKAQLVGLTPGTTMYSDQLVRIAQAQAAVNAQNQASQGPLGQIANQLSEVKSAWASVQSEVLKFTGPLIVGALNGMVFAIHALPPIIEATSKALEPFVAEWTKFTTAGSGDSTTVGSGMKAFVNWVVQNGIPNLQRLIVFVQEVGKAVVDIATSFTSQGAGLTEWLDKVGASLDKWGSDGGFTRFAATVSSMMPEIEKALASLGESIAHIVTALHDFSGAALTQLTIVSALIASLPIGAIQAFFVAFEAYKVINAGVAAFKAMATVIDVLKAGYALAATAQAAFALGTEGATAAEGSNILVTSAMAAGRLAMATATFVGTLATEGWTAAMLTADGAMAPVILTIGLIVLAVAALGIGIYELVDHWSTVWSAMKTAFDVAWSGIKSGFDEVVSFMRGEWGLFVLAIPIVGWMLYVAANWKSIWGDIDSAFNASISALKSAWDSVSSALSSAWSAVWTAMRSAATAVWTFLVGEWNSNLDMVKSAWDSVSSALSSAWSTFWNALKAAAMAVWSFLVSDWTNNLDMVKSAFDTVASSVSGAWNTFWNTLKTVASTVWGDIESGVSGFATGVESAFTKLVSTVGSIWSGIESVFSTPVNVIIRIWNDIAGAIGLPKIGSTGASSGAMPTGTQSASTSSAGTVSTGGAKGFAGGGMIEGPGTGTSDSIHAMVSKGEFIMPADKTAQHRGALESMRSGGLPHFSIGGIVGDVTGAVSGAVGDVTSTVGGIASSALNALKTVAATAVYDTAKPLIDGAVSAVPNPVPGVSIPGGSVPHAGAQTLGDQILDKLKASQATAQAAAASVGGTVPTGQHLTDITQALQKAGVPQSQWATWEAGLNTLITRESGWNASAINMSDSNAAAGHPSQGLMQTIPSTFAAYSLGGSITDPVSNIVAGIRYIMATYGGIQNVQQANANLPPKGYDTGGALMPGLTLANNTTGTVEGVLNPTGLSAIGGLGALSSLNSGGGFRSAASGGGGTGTQGGGTTVVINAPITINAEGADADQIAVMIEAEFDKLATMIEAEVGTH